MSVWDHVLIEAYCTFKFLSQKNWKGYAMLKGGKTAKKPTITKNPNYIPKKWRPKWCIKNNKKRLPQFKCLCDNKNQRCPFFTMTEATKQDKKLFESTYQKEGMKK